MSVKRIQRRRTKGWRMPQNTVYTGRGSKWGNPWIISSYQDAVDGVRVWAVDKGSEWDATFGPEPGLLISPETRARWHAVNKYREWIALADLSVLRTELAGKNLACWCPLDQPCHADVLIELANQEES